MTVQHRYQRTCGPGDLDRVVLRPSSYRQGYRAAGFDLWLRGFAVGFTTALVLALAFGGWTAVFGGR